MTFSIAADRRGHSPRVDACLLQRRIPGSEMLASRSVELFRLLQDDVSDKVLFTHISLHNHLFAAL
jgi:hypothetical protein